MAHASSSGWLTAACDLRSDTAAHVEAYIDCLALQQQYGRMRRLCDRLLGMNAWSGRQGDAWRFWRAFAAAAEGDSVSALADLDMLSGHEHALPVTALSIQIHRCAKVKDTDLLQSLKSSLRVASKRAPPAALLLAARYFLFTGQVSRARQCIEKRLKKERDDAHLLALFAWMDLRTAAAETPVPDGSADHDDAQQQAERDASQDRARNVLRKAIRIGTAEMRADGADAVAAAALSPAHTAAAGAFPAQAASASSPSSPPASLLLAYFGRVTQLQSRGETGKARRELEQLSIWFPRCALAIEWHVLATAAQGEWKNAMDACEVALQRLGAVAAAWRPPTAAALAADLNEPDSVCLRWLGVLHSLLHAPSLAASDASSRLSAWMSSLRTIEWRNILLLSRSARTLTALSRGQEEGTAHRDAALALLERAMFVQRQRCPSSAHDEMARLLVLQGEALLAGREGQSPGEGEGGEEAAEAALESFLEAYVMDEASAEPTIGQVRALLVLRRFDEAEKLLATLPVAAVRASTTVASPPLFFSDSSAVSSSPALRGADFHVSYYRALLAWHHSSDADVAASHLADALDLHMAMADSGTDVPDAGEGSGSGSGASRRAAAAVLDPDYFPRIDPPALLGMATLCCDMLDSTQCSRPESDTDETRGSFALLAPLIALLSRLARDVPGHARIQVALARLHYAQGDDAACGSSVQKGLELLGEAPVGPDTPTEAMRNQLAQLAAALRQRQSQQMSRSRSKSQSSSRRSSRKRNGAAAATFDEEEKERSPTAHAPPLHMHVSTPLQPGGFASAAAPTEAFSLFRSRGAADPHRPRPVPVSAPVSAPLVVSAALHFDRLANFDDNDDDLDGAEPPGAFSRRAQSQSQPPTAPLTRLQREMEADGARDRERRRLDARRRAEEEALEALDMRSSLQRDQDREQSARLSLCFTPSISPDASLAQLHPMQARRVQNGGPVRAGVSAGRSGGGGAGGADEGAGGVGCMSRDDSHSSLALVSRNSSTASLNSVAHAHTNSNHAHASHHAGLASSSSASSFTSRLLSSVSSLAYSPSSTPQSMSRHPSEGTLGPNAVGTGAATAGALAAPTSTFTASLALYNASPTAASMPPSLYTTAAERAQGHNNNRAQAVPIPAPVFTSTDEPSPSPASSEAAATSVAPAAPVAPPTRSLESARLLALKAAAAARAAEAEAAARFLQVARHGSSFWKHGRSGQPHERTVRLEVVQGPSSEELRFDWGSDRMVVRRCDARILLGKQSEVMQRDTARRSKPELCFTIVGAQRTLDLEARSKELRQQWVEGLTALLHREHAEPTRGPPAQHASHASISGPSSSLFGQTNSGVSSSSIRPTPPSTQR